MRVEWPPILVGALVLSTTFAAVASSTGCVGGCDVATNYTVDAIVVDDATGKVIPNPTFGPHSFVSADCKKGAMGGGACPEWSIDVDDSDAVVVTVSAAGFETLDFDKPDTNGACDDTTISKTFRLTKTK